MSTAGEFDSGRASLEARIDRITLHVTDMDPIDARRLAQAVALALAPTLALALYAQRYLVEGLSLGALKG